jgi:hypothetical protein
VASLNAICVSAQAQKVVADLRVQKLNFDVIKYEILTARLGVVQGLIDSVSGPITEGLAFYPSRVGDLVNECVQIGDFLSAPQEITASIQGALSRVLFKIREMTSFTDEIGTEIERLTQLSALLEEVCQLVDTIVVELTSPPAA